jgi:hypothetical protein
VAVAVKVVGPLGLHPEPEHLDRIGLQGDGHRLLPADQLVRRQGGQGGSARCACCSNWRMNSSRAAA